MNLPNDPGFEDREPGAGFFGWLGHLLVEGVKALARGFDKAENAFNSRFSRLER
jgi:hypothetical protein